MPGLAKWRRRFFGGGLLLASAALWAGSSAGSILAAESCPDLQALIDSAEPGATISAPACLYRTSLDLDQPITLLGAPGAVIDGSDEWTAWDGTTSQDVLPAVVLNDACRTERACPDPREVLFDGSLLRFVDQKPSIGEFSVDAGRHVVLGQDPAGHRVDVVVRQTWIVVTASDVTVDGFTMRYASNPAQSGAVRVEAGVSRFALRGCDLGYAAGANLAFGLANDSVVEDCDIHDGGQLGVHLGGDGTNGRDNVLRANTIHDNNTAGFDPEWEAGGVKATRQTGLRITGNTVSDNVGPGLWCDIECRDIVVSGNRVDHNTHAGIFFEVSTGASIADNRVWENGWGKTSWGWGAGILVSSSGRATVSDNIVAWNAAGISVISQDRTDWNHSETDNDVHGNVVIAEHGRYTTLWGQDWAGPLFLPASDNHGSSNRYWVDHAEDGARRFGWDGDMSTLSRYEATPAEEGGSYLTDDEKSAILLDADMPTNPFASHPGDLSWFDDPPLIVAGILLLGVAVAVLAVLVASGRRPRRR
jgi:nitrous oxidase accessory protein NosD